MHAHTQPATTKLIMVHVAVVNNPHARMQTVL